MLLARIPAGEIAVGGGSKLDRGSGFSSGANLGQNLRRSWPWDLEFCIYILARGDGCSLRNFASRLILQYRYHLPRLSLACVLLVDLPG